MKLSYQLNVINVIQVNKKLSLLNSLNKLVSFFLKILIIVKSVQESKLDEVGFRTTWLAINPVVWIDHAEHASTLLRCVE